MVGSSITTTAVDLSITERDFATKMEKKDRARQLFKKAEELAEHLGRDEKAQALASMAAANPLISRGRIAFLVACHEQISRVWNDTPLLTDLIQKLVDAEQWQLAKEQQQHIHDSNYQHADTSARTLAHAASKANKPEIVFSVIGPMSRHRKNRALFDAAVIAQKAGHDGSVYFKKALEGMESAKEKGTIGPVEELEFQQQKLLAQCGMLDDPDARAQLVNKAPKSIFKAEIEPVVINVASIIALSGDIAKARSFLAKKRYLSSESQVVDQLLLYRMPEEARDFAIAAQLDGMGLEIVESFLEQGKFTEAMEIDQVLHNPRKSPRIAQAVLRSAPKSSTQYAWALARLKHFFDENIPSNNVPLSETYIEIAGIFEDIGQAGGRTEKPSLSLKQYAQQDVIMLKDANAERALAKRMINTQQWDLAEKLIENVIDIDRDPLKLLLAEKLIKAAEQEYEQYQETPSV